MTAPCGYGGLNFSTACKVLIRDFSDIYPEWAKLAKIASVIPVSKLHNEVAWGRAVTRLMRISSCAETLHTFKTAAAHFTHAKMRKK